MSDCLWLLLVEKSVSRNEVYPTRSVGPEIRKVYFLIRHKFGVVGFVSYAIFSHGVFHRTNSLVGIFFLGNFYHIHCRLDFFLGDGVFNLHDLGGPYWSHNSHDPKWTTISQKSGATCHGQITYEWWCPSLLAKLVYNYKN